MPSKNFIIHSFSFQTSIIAVLNKFYWLTGRVAGMSSLLVVFLLLVYRHSGWYGFPTFVADHGNVSSPPSRLCTCLLNDDEHP